VGRDSIYTRTGLIVSCSNCQHTNWEVHHGNSDDLRAEVEHGLS
jgi:hypothetical protein